MSERTSEKTSAKTSASADRGIDLSDAVGVVPKTRKPDSASMRAPYRQSVVFPIPASPTMNNTEGLSPEAAANAAMRASSSSRPTTCGSAIAMSPILLDWRSKG